MRDIRLRIRKPVRWIAWLLLGYPAESVTWSEWTQWPVPASGIGAVRTFVHGVAYGALLVALLVWHYRSGTDDDYSVAFLVHAYCPLPGFLAGIRTRSVGRAGAAGALTALTGSAIALVVIIVLTHDTSLLRFVWALVTTAIFGYVLGAVGGMLALPCWSLIASLDSRREGSAAATRHHA